MDKKVLSQVSKSFGRCAMVPSFFDDFYSVFLSSSPEVEEKFKNTDFERQKGLIRSSITYMIMFAKGSEVARDVLARVAIIHDKAHFDVRAELYPLWVDSLIATLRKHDSGFDDDLERQWRMTLKPGIDFLISKYHAG